MNKIAKVLIPLILLTVSGAASAATVDGTSNVSWGAVTQGCLVGVTPCVPSTLTGADVVTGYEVFASTSPIPDDLAGLTPVAVTSATATSASARLTVPNGSTVYIRVRAFNASIKGVLSNVVTRVVQVPVQPGAPTDVTFEITIDLTTVKN